MNEIIAIANKLTKIGEKVSAAKATLNLLDRSLFDSDQEYIEYLVISANSAHEILAELDVK